MSRISLALALIAISLTPAVGWANAYKILGVRSVKASAMGEAFVATADDASATSFNPAGLAQQRGRQISIQGTACNSYTEHTAPSGEQTDINEGWQLVPALYATTDFGSEILSAGLGISVPNGLATEWEADSFARYVSTYSSLSVVDVTPAIGVKVTDGLMLGAGLNFYYAEAQLDSMLDGGLAVGMPGQMDLPSSLQGDGTAWGFTAGALWQLSKSTSLGLVYRHPYTVELDGDYAVAGSRLPMEAEIDFPMAIIGGVAYRPGERWLIELNLDWTYWEGVDDIRIRFDDAAIPDTAQIQALGNTTAVKLGGQYGWSQRLDLRAGYVYNQNATPEAHWRPSLPNTDTHFLTTGFGWTKGRVTLDGALQLIFYETRTIDNNVDGNEDRSSSSVDGTYRTFAPCVSLAATTRF